jgi:hypothetical protein
VLPQTHVDEFGIADSILDVLQQGPYAPQPGCRRMLWPKWLCGGSASRQAGCRGGECSRGGSIPDASHTLKAMRARCEELRRAGDSLTVQQQGSAGAAEVASMSAAGAARRAIEQQLGLTGWHLAERLEPGAP